MEIKLPAEFTCSDETEVKKADRILGQVQALSEAVSAEEFSSGENAKRYASTIARAKEHITKDFFVGKDTRVLRECYTEHMVPFTTRNLKESGAAIQEIYIRIMMKSQYDQSLLTGTNVSDMILTAVNCLPNFQLKKNREEYVPCDVREKQEPFKRPGLVANFLNAEYEHLFDNNAAFFEDMKVSKFTQDQFQKSADMLAVLEQVNDHAFATMIRKAMHLIPQCLSNEALVFTKPKDIKNLYCKEVNMAEFQWHMVLELLITRDRDHVLNHTWTCPSYYVMHYGPFVGSGGDSKKINYTIVSPFVVARDDVNCKSIREVMHANDDVFDTKRASLQFLAFFFYTLASLIELRKMGIDFSEHFLVNMYWNAKRWKITVDFLRIQPISQINVLSSRDKNVSAQTLRNFLDLILTKKLIGGTKISTWVAGVINDSVANVDAKFAATEFAARQTMLWTMFEKSSQFEETTTSLSEMNEWWSANAGPYRKAVSIVKEVCNS